MSISRFSCAGIVGRGPSFAPVGDYRNQGSPQAAGGGSQAAATDARASAAVDQKRVRKPMPTSVWLVAPLVTATL